MSARDLPANDAEDAAYDPLLHEPLYPFQELLGYRIVEWNATGSVVEMDIDERHMNRHGIVHGGVYSVLIDTACGFAGSWCGEPGRFRRAMTLSLTVDFLAVARGKSLTAKGRVKGGGRNVFFAEGEVRDDTGTLVATGNGVFRYRKGSGDPAGAGV